MVYNGLTLEEDTKKYREFLKSQIFRNASSILTHIETDNGGLTAAEIWEEVDGLIKELRRTEPEDREALVSHLYSKTRRKVQDICRDGKTQKREIPEIEQTVTCILYCLALRLEATCKEAESNPHNDLLDALVEELIRLDHPILPLLHKGIKAAGDKYENKAGRELIVEHDLLKIGDGWKEQLGVVFDHYADRISNFVDSGHREKFDALWKTFIEDTMVSQLMKDYVPIKGDEHKELDIQYNAKALFNIYGLLYRKGFFTGINGETPLAKKLTEHYDCETGNLVSAKYEYFKSDQAGIKPQFDTLDGDMYSHIMNIITPKR